MFTNFPFFPAARVGPGGPGRRASSSSWSRSPAFFSVLIAALVVVFAIKYQRKHDDEVGAAIHGSLALELLWTVIPFGIAMVMFVWGAQGVLRPDAAAASARWKSTSSASSGCGRSSTWTGLREINELHVPVGRPVKLIMGSEDVIHSFFIPAFRVKADVVPGRYTTHVVRRPTKPGTYHLFCAEYCGTKHSGMIGWVIGDGAGRLRGVAGRRHGRRTRRSRPARSCSRISPASPAIARRRAGPRPGADGRLRPRRSSSQDGADGDRPTRPTSASRS